MSQATSEADRITAVRAALAIPPDEQDRAQAARKRAEFTLYEREHYDAIVAALGEGFDVDALSGHAQHVLVWLARADDWTIDGLVELLRTARLLEGVHAVREQAAAAAPRRRRDDPLDGQLSIHDAGGGS